MPKAKITTKGQITIPKSVRERLGLGPGQVIEFIEEGGRFRIEKQVADSPFEKYVGYLEHLRGRTSDELVDEMRGS